MHRFPEPGDAATPREGPQNTQRSKKQPVWAWQQPEPLRALVEKRTRCTGTQGEAGYLQDASDVLKCQRNGQRWIIWIYNLDLWCSWGASYHPHALLTALCCSCPSCEPPLLHAEIPPCNKATRTEPGPAPLQLLL